MSLLRETVVPVADEADARTTARALEPRLDGIERVVVVHVIEKGGGVVDKAPLEKRQADAAALLDAAEDVLGDAVDVETRVAYGTDVATTVFELADEADATAVAFRPRGGSRIARLLSGDTTARLASDPPVPTVSLPEPEGP